MRLTPVVTGLTLAATLVPVGLPLTAAAATSCAPPTTLLSRTPTVRSLPGGASMRVWDTGPMSGSVHAQRIVAVRIPATSALRARVVSAGHLTAVTTVGTYASRVATSVVTVNGSVFDPNRGLPVELVQQSGVPLKGDTSVQGVVAIGPDRKAFSDWLHLSGKAVGGGHTWPVTGLNWGSVTGSGVNVYSTAWGTTARPYGVVDVVVANGKVVARRTGTARGKAPATGQQVITANGTVGNQLAALRVGDALSLSYGQVSAKGRKVVDAIARGHRYVYDNGKGTEGGSCSTRDEQLRPRTAVGWTANGDTLVVTVSGHAVINGVMYGGSTHHQMPTYLKQLGAVEALGLDGGGSTTMFVRSTATGTPWRVDRPGAPQRRIPNALAWY